MARPEHRAVAATRAGGPGEAPETNDAVTADDALTADDAFKADESACSGHESFALRVLGHDMAPEFADGDIIIVEPDGVAKDGSFVLAWWDGQWLFRQLRRAPAEGASAAGSAWRLVALAAECAEHRVVELADLSAVRGVVVQKAVPGRRKLSKFYV
jgi:hypothetical protein